jgi:virginiamycin B lyase
MNNGGRGTARGVFLLCAATALALAASASAQQIAVGAYAVPTVNNYNPASYGVEGIAAGPDGALWYTELRAGKIGRITTAGEITEYPVPSPSSGGGPAGITVGPDGALWFTDGDTIGRITTAGEVSEFPVSGPHSGLLQITSGPDGALWFTATYDSSVGRMTTAGAVTVYPLPNQNSYPIGITTGPDGALWFTEEGYNRIGRITTAGAITEYSNLTTVSGPGQIVTGPDGALWFTETSESGGAIGRVTTAGTFTAYLLGSFGGEGGITVGPDGALWFMSYSGQESAEIGRITTAGAVSFYPVPFHIPQSLNDGITVGPDGELWFTLWENNSIGEAFFVTAPLSVSPVEGFFKSNLTFAGSEFAPNESVEIYKGGVGSAVLASATADSTGSFTTSVRASESAYLFGPRIFVGVGQTSRKLGAASFTLKPRLVLTPAAGAVGSTVTIEGYGFGSMETVGIAWDVPRTFLGKVTADLHGTFSGSATLTFSVPSGAAPGKNVVYGHGQATGIIGSGSFTVD